MRHAANPSATAKGRYLAWWLTVGAAAALCTVAVVAWQAANRQRQDGEGALRQAASDAAARMLASITESEYRERALPYWKETGARPSEIHPPIKLSWFDASGDPADWIFGPWPQPESTAAVAFNKALALNREGKPEESRKTLAALEKYDPLSPETGTIWKSSIHPIEDSTVRKAPMGTTTAGLPLGPLYLRHLMDTAADKAERRRRALDLLSTAVINPSVLTHSFVEDAAAVLAENQTREEQHAIEKARAATARGESLRRILKENRQAVIDRKPWIGIEWNLAYPAYRIPNNPSFFMESGFLAVWSSEELAGWITKQGIAASVPGLPNGWTFRARRDGAYLPAAAASASVLASKDSGSWTIEVISLNPSLAFAAMDEQLTRQRWLISGSTALMCAALGGFLLVLARQRRLNAMMSNFVASVSHELRAPVASMGLLAERLGDGRISGEEETARYHKLLCGEFRRISATIENVLAFSRRERGRHVYEHELSDLTALLQDTVEIVRPLADERGVLLSVNLPETSVERELDPIAIRQAVLNLLDNALKFSPRGGTIHLTLREENGEALITVRDEGPGVPLEERSRIFEPFYRIGSELRRETPGVGIGLSIVRDAAVAHRGSVSVNGSPGAGAEFILRIDRPVSES
ncbi:MAG TPA: HAMP domain-containing sensor histidine kinase [Verrucomicrobiales bacterium]|nr:HAMP domain-containing sensor histidine kinase [Verrucomicrobiales bacterium]